MLKYRWKKMLEDKAVFIGGVGGSGTRAVANVVNSLGVFMGSNVNAAFDNLDWPSRHCAPLLRDRSRNYEDSFPEVSPALVAFCEKMRTEAEAAQGKGARWGTKVPGSFFYLRYLAPILENMRYIHVIRHGLDMAFSKNHNQLINWGGSFDIPAEAGVSPRQLLKYWACANTYALNSCQAWLPGRHMVIRFEELCSDSVAHRQRIAEFLMQRDTGAGAEDIGDRIVPQESQERYKRLARREMFDECDLATLRELGFTADFPNGGEG